MEAKTSFITIHINTRWLKMLSWSPDLNTKSEKLYSLPLYMTIRSQKEMSHELLFPNHVTALTWYHSALRFVHSRLHLTLSAQGIWNPAGILTLKMATSWFPQNWKTSNILRSAFPEIEVERWEISWKRCGKKQSRPTLKCYPAIIWSR